MSLKVLALFLGSSFMTFIISSCWNSLKVNFSLLGKCSWILLIDWFLKRLSRCFRGVLFSAADSFFLISEISSNLYLFKVCDVFLLSLIILLLSCRMIMFAVLIFLEKRGVWSEFLSICKILRSTAARDLWNLFRN